MTDEDPTVEVYTNGYWQTRVEFKRKWQALLFHVLLNRSQNSAGSRNY